MVLQTALARQLYRHLFSTGPSLLCHGRAYASLPDLACLGKLLVANRGEIACRVIKTARALGVPTVAVHSDADARALHVQMADEAVHIGPSPPRESYLNIDKIIDAARRTNARSVHPGYGFLSENQQFVARCEEEGITFVGPPASAIHAMGNKSEAKAIMVAAKVPVVPGYHGPNQDPEFLESEAQRIGFPLLVKAVLGGGGKGMKIANALEDFQEALASAKREARAAFNDEAVLLERLVQRPRHVEVQVLADRHGNCVYLFERDCSVQRRHQKVIEEAPAPGLSAAKRREIGEAAVAAARAVGYVNAGTVEFIVDTATQEFFFMEMNTRLQVEHPVTEMVSGLDLVEFQLRVAAGQRLPLSQQQLRCTGHAFEARIYAERPQQGFLPAGGTVHHWRLPPRSSAFSLEMSVPRVDSGVRLGDEVGVHYDPLIAKLITWGEEREEALARLRAALAHMQVGGVPTNIEFLSKLAAHPAFIAADLDTAFISRFKEDLLPSAAEAASHDVPSHVLAAAVVAKLCWAMWREAAEAAASGNTARGPWATNDGFRLGPALTQQQRLTVHGGPDDVECVLDVTFAGADAFDVRLPGTASAAAVQHSIRGVLPQGQELHFALDGMKKSLTMATYQHGPRQHLDVWMEGHHFAFSWPLQTWSAYESAHPSSGQLVSPMTGKVAKVSVKEGQRVKAKDVVVVVEAMKMEHAVVAPADGVVSKILVSEGQTVQDSFVLAVIDVDDKDAPAKK